MRPLVWIVRAVVFTPLGEETQVSVFDNQAAAYEFQQIVETNGSGAIVTVTAQPLWGKVPKIS
jgi:hypothetical protein